MLTTNLTNYYFQGLLGYHHQQYKEEVQPNLVEDISATYPPLRMEYLLSDAALKLTFWTGPDESQVKAH